MNRCNKLYLRCKPVINLSTIVILLRKVRRAINNFIPNIIDDFLGYAAGTLPMLQYLYLFYVFGDKNSAWEHKVCVCVTTVQTHFVLRFIYRLYLYFAYFSLSLSITPRVCFIYFKYDFFPFIFSTSLYHSSVRINIHK